MESVLAPAPAAEAPAAPAPAPAATPAAPAAPAAEPQLSPEAMLAKAMGLGEPDKLRDPESGRFLAKPKPPGAEEPPQQQPAQADGEAQPAEAAQPDAPVYIGDEDLKKRAKIKVQGEEIEVSLEDALRGHMREADYTRKTKELAETRRQVQAQSEQALNGERAAYMQALASLRDVVLQAYEPELKQVDWNRLAKEEPAKYVQLQARAQQFQGTLQAIQQQQAQVQQKQAQDSQKALAQAVAEARVAIKEAIPAWNDDLYSSILKRGVDTYGYTQQELSQTYDPRFVRMLHDAHQWNELQSKKPLVDKKVAEAAPKAVKPGASQQNVGNANVERQVNAAKDQLRQTGSVDAFASFIGAMEKRTR